MKNRLFWCLLRRAHDDLHEVSVRKDLLGERLHVGVGQVADRLFVVGDVVQAALAVEQVAEQCRERKQQQSILNRARGEAARCEAAVSKAEAELDEINEELAKPYIASDYKKACELSERAAEKRQQIDELYKKWEAAEERLAELTSADD